jgi:ABC-type branched-subunit amino acid transport system ATPase component
MGVSLRIATVDSQSLPSDPAALENRLEALERSGEGLARHFPQPGDSFQVSVSEAMLFANNVSLQKDLLDGTGNLAKRLMQESDLSKRAEIAIRNVLCLPPRRDEARAIAAYLAERQDRAEAACQQVIWALLTSAEFRFNH